MGAIAALGLSPPVAVVQSIAAGADMVMTWPQDLDKVHGALVQALVRGELDRERVTGRGSADCVPKDTV